MKVWVKVLLGIGGTLILLGVVGAVLLVQSRHWKDIRGFSGGMVDITRSARAMERLAEHHMTAREFTWLHLAVRKARKEAGEKAGSPMALELLETLKRVSKAPGLEAPLRRELDQKVSRYELGLGKAKGPLSFNATLCLAQAERLGAAELGEGGDIILGGMKKGNRR